MPYAELHERNNRVAGQTVAAIMIKIDPTLTPQALVPKLEELFELNGRKVRTIAAGFDPAGGAPVFTVNGTYVSRGWTEWTQGFQYGAAILQYDATGEDWFLQWGRARTVERMGPHITHFGVHDHGFNNLSTYGNLLRLAREDRADASDWERRFYELALKASAAVQARRWRATADGRGYLYSFNGPHSLFADTLRSLRVLAVGHQLGHRLLVEHDEAIPLLGRLIDHAGVTADCNVYYGEGRDAYDVRGRVAHESTFSDRGVYRCPNSQQGYSPFSTWTRGLAWIILGFAEQLEFLDALADDTLARYGGRAAIREMMRKAATACGDFYLENTPSDGIPYWDTGAPGLTHLGDYLDRPADPFNPYEPADSSAAAIAAQGLLRLGHHLQEHGEADVGARYWQAGLTVVDRLFDDPYLSRDDAHQGLILHSVYHRPKGWDHIPAGCSVPCGESGLWGDYHAVEVALYLLRIVQDRPYLAFFLQPPPHPGGQT